MWKTLTLQTTTVYDYHRVHHYRSLQSRTYRPNADMLTVTSIKQELARDRPETTRSLKRYVDTEIWTTVTTRVTPWGWLRELATHPINRIDLRTSCPHFSSLRDVIWLVDNNRFRQNHPATPWMRKWQNVNAFRHVVRTVRNHVLDFHCFV